MRRRHGGCPAGISRLGLSESQSAIAVHNCRPQMPSAIADLVPRPRPRSLGRRERRAGSMGSLWQGRPAQVVVLVKFVAYCCFQLTKLLGCDTESVNVPRRRTLPSPGPPRFADLAGGGWQTLTQPPVGVLLPCLGSARRHANAATSGIGDDRRPYGGNLWRNF